MVLVSESGFFRAVEKKWRRDAVSQMPFKRNAVSRKLRELDLRCVRIRIVIIACLFKLLVL